MIGSVKRILICLCIIISMFSFTGCGGDEMSVDDTKIQMEDPKTGEIIEVDKGKYYASKDAYNQIKLIYDEYQEYYDCVEFYRNIGADSNSNDEYKNAIRKCQELEIEYQNAINAYEENFPEFPLSTK